MAVPWRFQAPIVDRVCRLVFAGEHFHAALPLTQALLEERKLPVQLIHAPQREHLLQVAPTADVAVPFMETFDESFIDSATNLRLIIQFGVGLELISVEKATERCIAVSNIPASGTGNAQATAEHAIFLTISLLRSATYHLPKRFRNGQLGGLPIPRALYKKNVTVVGYGAVGSKLCQYLVCMGANVTAVRRKWNNRVEADIVQSTNLNDALPTSDIVILACSLNSENLHMINDASLERIKHGAMVVNVGRGPLVHYEAIVKALESGKVGGFASDVGVGHAEKPSEPWDCNDKICNFSNVIFTPHVGGYTDYSYDIMAHRVVDATENVMHGQPPNVWVNKPIDWPMV